MTDSSHFEILEQCQSDSDVLLSSPRRDDGLAKHWRNVLDREAFRSRLRQERARSDRRASEFVVLGYSPRDGARGLEPIAWSLAQRVRGSDCVGWLNPSELGVLLLHVGVEEAQRLAVELVHDIPGAEAPLHCVLYPHPPLPWTRGKARAEDLGETRVN